MAEPGQILILTTLLAFYLGTLEWCHCQRDTWMLFPALAAVIVRTRWVGRSLRVRVGESPQSGSGQTGSSLRAGFAEGCLWAIGFWLKPFIAIPALAVIGISLCLVQSPKQMLVNVASLLAGGLAVGAAGIVWMMANGCWPHFLDTLFNWNGQYFRSGRSRWTLERLLLQGSHFAPWVWLHVPALVISLTCTVDTVRERTLVVSRGPARKSPVDVLRVLLLAMYPAWLVQSVFLQQPFDYVHVPGLLMAIAICAGQLLAVIRRAEPTRLLAQFSAAAFVGVALLHSPFIARERWTHWLTCVRAFPRSELPAEVKDAISLGPLPRWTELQPLLDHVASLHPADRTVLAHSCYLIHVYPRLNLHAPTRYVYLDVLGRLIPNRCEEMMQAVNESPAEWVIADLVESGWEGPLPEQGLLPDDLSRHPHAAEFPWNQTPVYRSGGYVLFRLTRPAGELTSESLPLRWSAANTPTAH